MDTTFPHSYEVRELTRLPNFSLPRYSYPGASQEGGRDGMLLEVHPERGVPWIGVFAFCGQGGAAPPEVYTMPNATWLCVIIEGVGYLVSAPDPTAWECAAVESIIHVYPLRAPGVLILASFQILAACGEGGLRWVVRHPNISYDLWVAEITDEFIRGEAGLPGIEEWTERFCVDLETGEDREGCLETTPGSPERAR